MSDRDDRRIIDAQEVPGEGVHVDPFPAGQAPEPPPQDEGNIRINRKPPLVTKGLLAVIAAVFVVQCIVGFMYWDWVPDMPDKWQAIDEWATAPFVLVYMGAKNSALIAQLHQYWRLLCCVFLHGGLWHMLMNGFGLYMWGRQIETLFGRAKTLLIFLIAGLGGSLLSYACSPNWSVGASGALFGFLGALLYFRKRNPILFKRVFGPQVVLIIVINAAYGFMNAGIDNYGHLGGLAAGYLAAWALGLYQEKRRSAMAFALLAVFTTVCLVVGQLRFGA